MTVSIIDGRYHVKHDRMVNGKRVRKTRILPDGFDLEDAQRVVAILADPSLLLKERIRRSIDAQAEEVGFIYVIKNQYLPGLVKIGMTTTTVQERIRAFSTAYPADFEIVGAETVKHVSIIETAIHIHFGEHRVNPRREFFRISDQQALDALAVCAEIDGVNLIRNVLNAIG